MPVGLAGMRPYRFAGNVQHSARALQRCPQRAARQRSAVRFWRRFADYSAGCQSKK